MPSTISIRGFIQGSKAAASVNSNMQHHEHQQQRGFVQSGSNSPASGVNLSHPAPASNTGQQAPRGRFGQGRPVPIRFAPGSTAMQQRNNPTYAHLANAMIENQGAPGIAQGAGHSISFNGTPPIGSGRPLIRLFPRR